MINWLRLIRYKNLLIVFLTQLLVWYCLIYDSRNTWGIYRMVDFLFISGSTILIAAAGYIINDYFDIKIDIINRPEKVILEKRIPLRTAIIAHVVLNVAGLALAGGIAFNSHHIEWIWVQCLSVVLLWFYSTHFKRQYMTGNLVIALLTALTVIVLLVYEPALRMHFRTPPTMTSFLMPAIAPKWMFAGFAYFAFMLTWMREIVKDMEDYKGDAAEGCMTMPIKMGLQFSARFAQTLGITTVIALAVITYYLIKQDYPYLGYYSILFIIAPILWWCIYLSQKNTTTHYHSASKWLKFIMLSGIASLIVYNFTTQNIQ